jgi:hypothetical protein
MAIDTNAMIYCVDVTAFDGVTFWAKAATAGSKVGVNFVVPETNMPDGDCTTACYNHPQKQITLTTEWAQYSVTFAQAMGGTGAKVNGRIQELGFLSPDSNWDFPTSSPERRARSRGARGTKVPRAPFSAPDSRFVALRPPASPAIDLQGLGERAGARPDGPYVESRRLAETQAAG